MKPSDALARHHQAIRRIVEAHNACNPRVFGSVASGTDREESDLDILVEPAPGMTLLDLGAIRHELKRLLGVEVDVLTPRSLPDEYRDRVLAEAAAIRPTAAGGTRIVSRASSPTCFRRSIGSRPISRMCPGRNSFPTRSSRTR